MTCNLVGTQLEVARIQSEINRLFETLIRLRDGGAANGTWSPGVDVAETAEELMIDVELPGVTPESLELCAQSGYLVIKGDRPSSGLAEQEGADLLHGEREYGPFEQRVPLNTAVNTHRAVASFERGVLCVRLPKVPNRRGEAVPITVGGCDAGRE